MIVVGLDGCSRGWIAVRMDGAKRELCLLASFTDLLAKTFDRAGIDMPIGLPDRGERACDLEARAMLRPHASRVFTGARRGLWNHPSHDEANLALKSRGEKGVSIQLWHLGPKIIELDANMTGHMQKRVREAHPELVFLRLNFGRPLAAKKTAEGLALRVRLLRREGFSEVGRWVEAARGGVKPDDIVDACAAAIAARDFGQGNVLPRGTAPKDAKGLKMQIWY